MRVLLAVDATPESEFAAREVARRPWPSRSVVRVLTVMSADPAQAPRDVPVPSAPLSEVPPWPVGTLRTREIWNAEAQRVADSAAKIVSAAAIHAEPVMREGAVGPAIVREAIAWHADLIVVGARPHGMLHRVLRGSVAGYLLQHAPCSIEVVREAQYGEP